MFEIINYVENGDTVGLLLYLLFVFLAMCIAVSFHEWAHAFVAYKLGDPTAKNLGRMSLDPLKHLSVAGMISFLEFRIGWAKPVMVNPRNLKHFRRDDALISLAGPLTNLILSFVFFGIWFFCAIYQVNGYILEALMYIVTINISFAIFNVLPIPPLDGFHVITSLFVKKGYKILQFMNKYGILILLVLLLTGVLNTVLTAVLNGFFNIYGAFFRLFI